MKKRSVTILLISLYLLLICAAAVAAGFGVFDIRTQDGASLTPMMADGTPIIPESGEGMEYYPGAERLSLSYSGDIQSGREYLVMVIKGASRTPTDENLVYLNQLTAAGSRIDFDLFPSELENGARYHVYLSTNASGSDGMREIAAFRYGSGEISFTLSETEITLPARSSYTLTVEGADEVIWSSSDENVATVQDGVVKGVRYGTASISATDGNAAAECLVHVLFSDVTKPGEYWYDPVYWAAGNGITKGYGDGSFGVGRNCQRRELAIFLWRYAGEPTVDKNGDPYGDARSMFNDMSRYAPDSATNQAIAWAYTKGITQGYSDGGFHPTAPIQRKDVMIMLWRLAGKPEVSGTLSFPDCRIYTTGSDTYKAILWGSQNEITKGYKDGTFGPKRNCLREQIAIFLYRYNGVCPANALDPELSTIDIDEEPEIFIID